MKTLTPTKYSKLVRDVRKIIESGKIRAAQAASQELVVTYWEVGKRISEAQLPDRAGYAQAILDDLSDELSIDVTTLIRALQLFEAVEVSIHVRFPRVTLRVPQCLAEALHHRVLGCVPALVGRKLLME